MNILIIGNGFDLAHSLPTKYEHFLKYVDAFKRFKDICKQESVKADWETANEEDKDFILGIDEYLEGYAKDRDNEFIQFKKFYQRIYKKTGCKYVDWII